MWISGLVGLTLDSHNKEGLLKEFLEKVEIEKKKGSTTNEHDCSDYRVG